MQNASALKVFVKRCPSDPKRSVETVNPQTIIRTSTLLCPVLMQFDAQPRDDYFFPFSNASSPAKGWWEKSESDESFDGVVPS